MKKKHNGNEDPGQVCEDILLLHILPKLPVKPLFQFKCVCKKWLRWISHDLAFICEQYRCSLASPGIVYMRINGGLEFFCMGGNPIDVPDPFLRYLREKISTRYHLSLQASCNGLLSLIFYKSDSTWGLCVGNPVTHEWSLLPNRKQLGFSALAFDPLDSPQTYKLVYLYRTRSHNDGMEMGFAVFSSDTDLWTESVEKVVIKKPRGLLSGSMFKGGILYWSFDFQIIWFDLLKNLAGVLLPPDTDGLEHRDGVLGVWEDEPSYTRIVGGTVIEAWTMTEFKWTRIYTVSLDSVLQGISNDGLCLQLSRCEQLVLHYHCRKFLYFVLKFLYFVLSTNESRYKILCYDTKTGEVTQSMTCHPPDFFEYNNNFVRVPKLLKHHELKA